MQVDGKSRTEFLRDLHAKSIKITTVLLQLAVFEGCKPNSNRVELLGNTGIRLVPAERIELSA